ncbi:hypothetical protein [Flavobacterium coralii]|uniref:hypothetical protein n=1 Tax=Flavobacterium coralii TaxID=2838017 RepID=UPI000C444570|nr:hypothetical protein [Flavobacterium sp.]|tara:strand:+ start:683 stop:979 length:297 start_codon:yes stop_codon:yes gene_type:complete
MNIFKNLNLFVPVGHDNTANDFFLFLSLLKHVPYYSKHVTLRVTASGIEILEYAPDKTLQEVCSWKTIGQIVNKTFEQKQKEAAERINIINNQFQASF